MTTLTWSCYSRRQMVRTQHPKAEGSKLGRPTKDDADQLPHRIVETAKQLMLAQGFEATSLNQIAVAAGVTKRTIYLKLGDKDALLVEVIESLLTGARVTLEDPGPDVSPTERLITFGNSLVRLALRPEIMGLFRLLITDGWRFPHLAELAGTVRSKSSEAQLAEILRDEVARGRLRMDDIDRNARLATVMILFDPQRAALIGAPWPPEKCEDWVRSAVALLLNGAITPP